MNPVLMGKDGLIAAMMAREAQRRFIPPGQSAAFGEYAWAKGQRAAVRTASQYPSLSPTQIAQEMGLTVEERPGDSLHYGEYTRGKNSITLFPHTIRSNFMQPEAAHLKSANYEKVRDLFLAHELFHHLECTDPAVGLTQREKQVVVFSIGPFQWKSGLRSLSEIAAHSFALRLAGEGIVY